MASTKRSNKARGERYLHRIVRGVSLFLRWIFVIQIFSLCKFFQSAAEFVSSSLAAGFSTCVLTKYIIFIT